MSSKKIVILVFILAIFTTFNLPTDVKADGEYIYNLEEQWSINAGKYDAIDIVRFDTDGSIYIANGGDFLSYIYALAADGDLKWEYNIRYSEFEHLFVTEDDVYVISTNTDEDNVLVIDKDNGRKKNQFTLELPKRKFINDLTMDYKGNIYVTAEDGLSMYEADGDKKWEFAAEIPKEIKPVFGRDNSIYIITDLKESDKYKLYAINGNGTVKWSSSLKLSEADFRNEYYENPMLFDEEETIYVFDGTKSVYSIDHNDGDINWKYTGDNNEEMYVLLKPDQDYYNSPNPNRPKNLVARTGDNIIAFTDQEVIAIDNENGRINWDFDKGNYIWNVNGQADNVYVMSDNIYSLDADGKVVWDYDLDRDGSNNIEMLIADNETIYLYQYEHGDDNGLLLAFAQDGDVKWESEDLPNTNHQWFATEKGLLYTTSNYTNGDYKTNLYSIYFNSSINKIKIDGIIVDLIERDNYVYISTPEMLYAFKYVRKYVEDDDDENNDDENDDDEDDDWDYNWSKNKGKKNKCNDHKANNGKGKKLGHKCLEIRLVIDGVEQDYIEDIAFVKGRILVPVRQIFASLEALVDWDSQTNSITISKKGKKIYIQADSNVAIINGKEIRLDVEAKILNGSFMLPLRFISEALGAEVEWDEDTQTIYITTK